MQRCRLFLPTCVAILSGFLATSASANGIVVELLVESDAIGDASASLFVFKNGTLLSPIDQIIELAPGDTLSVQIETFATGMPGDSVSAFGTALLLGSLADAGVGAEVTAQYHARVDSRGGDAFSTADFFYSCVAIGDCAAGSPPDGNAGIISDTVVGNAEIIDDELTPLPGFGGVLEQMVDRSFSLPAGGLPGGALIDFGVFTDTALFDNGDTAGASFLSLDIEVAPIIPIPAAVWLFGSALGLLGWLRSKSA